MTDQESYIFIIALSVILAVPFGFALRTLLAMEERVIAPILRMQTEAGEKRAIRTSGPFRSSIVLPSLDPTSSSHQRNSSIKEDFMITVDKLMTRKLVQIQRFAPQPENQMVFSLS